MSESGFPEAGRPGEQPKITKLADFSAEALGQLVQYLNGTLEVPLNQIIGYKKETQVTRLARVAAVSINDSTNTIIDWDTEVFDFGDLHDLSTNPSRITIKSAGKYMLGALAVFAGNVTGDRVLELLWNGSTVVSDFRRALSSVGLGTTVGATTILDMLAGDYAQVQVFQNSGGALNMTSGIFWVARLTT